MFYSVRTRLTLWYAGVLALSLVVFAVLVYYAASRIFYERQDESLRSTAQTVASAYIQELEEEQSIEKANEVVLAQMVFPNRYVQVTDTSGRIVATSSNLNQGGLIVATKTLTEAKQRRTAFTVLNNLRTAVVPLSPNKELGFAMVAEPLGVIEEALRRLRRDFFAGVPLILVFASIGGYFLARKSLAPIALMDRQTRGITAEKLSSRLDVMNQRDELGGLATTINELLARLESSFREQQRFVADASHELRTPLAILRGETDVALTQPRSVDEYKSSLTLIKDEAERLSRIVEDLFILARQPFEARAIKKEPMNLREIVGECARAAQVLAAQKDLHLTVDAKSPITLTGDDDLLRRLVLNLLDNAVKYTPEGGEISVKLTQQNGTALMIVSDSGIGIPQKDLPHVFDRFYRVDKARSRALGGAGLGLSIADWIVKAHGGELSVQSAPGKGSAFTVELPLNN
ncbi:MAG TPA: heavy metal sensor histidine kinase [Pyrinomonadaceae bacterium]|nr:heavy metal sensor histidine kinase [Pyrinomonadaceae bacterium]